MRTICVMALCLFSMSMFYCTEEKVEMNLKGTWKMTSGTYISPTDTVTCNVDNRLCYKILCDEHFSVVEMYLNKPDSLFFAAVGSYTISDSVYTETLEGSNVIADVGRTNVFHSEVKGNEWHIYMKRDDLVLDEIWVRIKKP